MSAHKLRNQLIRLAHENLALRPELLKVLARSEWDEETPGQLREMAHKVVPLMTQIIRELEGHLKVLDNMEKDVGGIHARSSRQLGMDFFEGHHSIFKKAKESVGLHLKKARWIRQEFKRDL